MTWCLTKSKAPALCKNRTLCPLPHDKPPECTEASPCTDGASLPTVVQKAIHAHHGCNKHAFTAKVPCRHTFKSLCIHAHVENGVCQSATSCAWDAAWPAACAGLLCTLCVRLIALQPEPYSVLHQQPCAAPRLASLDMLSHAYRRHQEPPTI